jgi:hypothetical protein
MTLCHKDAEGYLNRELMVLEHIKDPALFIRKAKKAYITVIASSASSHSQARECYKHQHSSVAVR